MESKIKIAGLRHTDVGRETVVIDVMAPLGVPSVAFDCGDRGDKYGDLLVDDLRGVPDRDAAVHIQDSVVLDNTVHTRCLSEEDVCLDRRIAVIELRGVLDRIHQRFECRIDQMRGDLDRQAERPAEGLLELGNHLREVRQTGVRDAIFVGRVEAGRFGGLGENFKRMCVATVMG